MAQRAYKTPDVYVEEISLFPPSVAEVETAIPAFIGYTEKAETLSAQSLSGIPTKIKSLLEFETYFGKGPKTNLTEVILDENNNFSKATIEPKYYLYDSIRLFFDNGGGNCYVVSVGVYPNGIDADTLKTGIEALKKYDEPTILLFPDAAGLPPSNLGSVQTAALMQCTALGDRVCVFDSQQDDPNGIEFRNNIGINNLKYGAAYTPWLKVNYGKSVSYMDVKPFLKKGTKTPALVSLKDLTTDKDIQANIQKLEDALFDVGDSDGINSRIKKHLKPDQFEKISDKFGKVLTDYQNDKNPKHMENIFNFLFGLATLIDGLLDTTTRLKGTDLRNDVEKAINNLLETAFNDLISNEKELDESLGTGIPDPYTIQWSSTGKNRFTTGLPSKSSIIPSSATTDVAKYDSLLPYIEKCFDSIKAAIDVLNTKISSTIDTSTYTGKLSAYKTSHSTANMQQIFASLFSLADSVQTTLFSADNAKRKSIDNSVTNSLKSTFIKLISYELELQNRITDYVPEYDGAGIATNRDWNLIFTTLSPLTSLIIPIGATTDIARCDAILPSIQKNFAIINEALNSFILAAAQYVKTYEKTLYDTFPIYQNLIKGINDTLTEVPPSGAIAGIYAMVDSQRGVWKAPANVSLASVVGPTYNFDSSETDALNIDANAGKSINAIRAFSGKGTLVWGARTLAGNDNEWRYVPVRRFFNMVEESIKKSTYWAVFEPNDANTWVKVRGMIENFLTQKWREGALAGATTKDAFFVKCGLGTTMTSQDILEGRMNIEIGMAVVRPAEFIILKFSHKLQTS